MPKSAVAREVKLPEGVHLEWAGEYGELQQANRRLMIVVPFALMLIAGVLYAATTSLIDTFVIMAQIPVACLGGVLALFSPARRSAFRPRSASSRFSASP